MTQYVKVCVSLSYIVPADNQEAIEYAKVSLLEDLLNIYKYNEVYDLIDVEDAPDADASDVSDLINEYINKE